MNQVQVQTKKCPKCQQNKGLDRFVKDKNRIDGLFCWCKDCVKAHTKKYRNENEHVLKLKKALDWEVNKEARAKEHSDYYWKNREKTLLKCKEYREKDPEKARARSKAYYYSEQGKKARQDYYEKNKPRISVHAREYAKKNIEKIRVRARVYRAKRKMEDPQFALRVACSNRVLECLKKVGVKKDKNSFELIGCSPSFLYSYIESQFTDGMHWGNHTYFGWHVDHKTPITSFDLTDPEQQKKAFHWTNQWPLWWRPNLEKGDKVCTEEELMAYRAYKPMPGEVVL